MNSRIHELSRVEPDNRAGWRRWLRANHAKSTGVWLVFRKGDARQLTYADSVEEALCFGWIDSLMRPINERTYMQLFTPRKPKSNWSSLNKQRVEMLLAKKRMAAAGLKAVAVAKENGSWTRLDDVEAMIIPSDFARALNANRKARTFFDAQSPSNRKGILYWINGVKSAEKRAERIAHAVAQAAKGLRPAHWEKQLAKAKAAAHARKQPR